MRLNDANREYFGFIITYVSYLLILLSIIYYEFFILNNVNLGIIGTIILIITGIIYPFFYYRTIKSDEEELNE
jgi:hypothetical protein